MIAKHVRNKFTVRETGLLKNTEHEHCMIKSQRVDGAGKDFLCAIIRELNTALQYTNEKNACGSTSIEVGCIKNLGFRPLSLSPY
jgi:hypothetical protein